MKPNFQLHRQLAEDCHVLGRLGNAHLLLHRNAAVPWFILVPEVEQEEFLELGAETQADLLSCCSSVGAFIKRRFGCQKLNFGAIGNVVSQLHLHVIGRGVNDACWPAPVWGNLQGEAGYQPDDLAGLKSELTEDLGLETVASSAVRTESHGSP